MCWDLSEEALYLSSLYTENIYGYSYPINLLWITLLLTFSPSVWQCQDLYVIFNKYHKLQQLIYTWIIKTQNVTSGSFVENL